MGAPILVPKIAPLRILPDPGAPPEATNPTALTRLERIALAQEMTAAAMVRIANRLDRIGDRIEKDALEMEELIANGGTLAVEAAAEAVRNDVLRLSKSLNGKGNHHGSQSIRRARDGTAAAKAAQA